MASKRITAPQILGFVSGKTPPCLEPSDGQSAEQVYSIDVVPGISDNVGICKGSTAATRQRIFETIVDRFTSLAEVTRSLEWVGMKQCGLIFGIDYTLSNRMKGAQTFGGRSLHDICDTVNPYQEVIGIIGETLESFDSDGKIPVYGFGDYLVKDKGVFPLKEDGDCEGFQEVLEYYNKKTPSIKLGGPTNFAPLIRKAVDIVKMEKQYHILVIVADGQVSNEEETIEALVQASDYPLSIILIGVGDGPWDVMKNFDDNLPKRTFDNFQFVDFHKVKSDAKNPRAAVALAALMEIPDQFQFIKDNGLIADIQ